MVPLVQELAHFRVALQHGADNLIVVMDDDEEDMALGTRAQIPTGHMVNTL